eukprot:jgi/Hompol1/6680/HPOL_000137-RA
MGSIAFARKLGGYDDDEDNAVIDDGDMSNAVDFSNSGGSSATPRASQPAKPTSNRPSETASVTRTFSHTTPSAVEAFRATNNASVTSTSSLDGAMGTAHSRTHHASTAAAASTPIDQFEGTKLGSNDRLVFGGSSGSLQISARMEEQEMEARLQKELTELQESGKYKVQPQQSGETPPMPHRPMATPQNTSVSSIRGQAGKERLVYGGSSGSIRLSTASTGGNYVAASERSNGPWPDSIGVIDLLMTLADENGWTIEEVNEDRLMLDKQRIRTVRDLRIISAETWQSLPLAPIVKDLLKREVLT